MSATSESALPRSSASAPTTWWRALWRRVAGAPARRTVALLGHPLEVRLSPAAVRRLADREQSLIAEIELYFSCLVRKQVRFHETVPAHLAPQAPAPVTPGLAVAFRPAVTRQCRMADAVDEVPLDTMPVVNPGALVPDWLHLDVDRRGGWHGEFGWRRGDTPSLD